MCSENILSDVIKQVMWGIQNVEQKVRRFSLLDPFEHRDGNIGAGNLCNILTMNLPGVVVRAHCSCILPSDARGLVRIRCGRVLARSCGWL